MTEKEILEEGSSDSTEGEARDPGFKPERKPVKVEGAEQTDQEEAGESDPGFLEDMLERGEEGASDFTPIVEEGEEIPYEEFAKQMEALRNATTKQEINYSVRELLKLESDQLVRDNESGYRILMAASEACNRVGDPNHAMDFLIAAANRRNVDIQSENHQKNQAS